MKKACQIIHLPNVYFSYKVFSNVTTCSGDQVCVELCCPGFRRNLRKGHLNQNKMKSTHDYDKLQAVSGSGAVD